MKHWLIIYDIRDVKRLSSIAKIMEGHGVRVQKSVFEAELAVSELDKLRGKIRKRMAAEDSVIFFDVCEADWQKRIKFGVGKYIELDEKSFRIL